MQSEKCRGAGFLDEVAEPEDVEERNESLFVISHGPKEAR
jgi:hypothetical protein